MHEAGGGGLTFGVVVEQLGAAAGDVRAVTQAAQGGEVEQLPTGVDVGHDRLTRVLWDFCGRWDRGLSLLVGDSTAMADTLEQTASDYRQREDDMETRYRGVRPRS